MPMKIRVPIVFQLVSFFHYPAGDGVVHFVVSAVSFFYKVVAEHILVEVAHRAHLKYHRLRVDKDVSLVVEDLRWFVVSEVGVNDGLLPCC